jgi:tetratricopeptide (TPR) repeat protein
MDGAGAEEAWKRSLQADPKYVKPYQPLIAMANQRHDWAQSEHLASEWINTDREAFPEAYLVDALANLMLDDLEKAEHSARESIRVDTQHQVSKSRYVLGYILGLRREFAASAEYFREYLTMAPHADNAALVRQQLDEYERAGLAAPKP